MVTTTVEAAPDAAYEPERPYARAGACARPRSTGDATTSVLLEHAVVFGGSVDEFRELAKIFRKDANRTAWRRIMARRNSAIAAMVRRIRGQLGERYCGRRKSEEGTRWTLFGRDANGAVVPVAAIFVKTPYTLGDLSAPVNVEVTHAMLDAEELRRACSEAHAKRVWGIEPDVGLHEDDEDEEQLPASWVGVHA